MRYLLGFTLLALPAWACLWDLDTLRMERETFPDTLELITGKFLRHSPAFYEWRIQDRLKKLAQEPKNLTYYDDLAVAYDKTGQHEKAIETILAKDTLKPGLYETEANLGTFYIHSGQLEKGLVHIENAIKINPDAHFGREEYQKLLVQYILKQKELTAADLLAEPRGYSCVGFAKYVLQKKEIDPHSSEANIEIGKAIKGILGMMRFGNFESPALLVSLGDLLISRGGREKAHRLAARAYLNASYHAEEEERQAMYRGFAKRALSGQTKHPYTYGQLLLEELEAALAGELKEATSWYAKLEANEQKWIAESGDPDAEFSKAYYKEPVVLTSLFDFIPGVDKTTVLVATLIAMLVASIALPIRRARRKRLPAKQDHSVT